MTSKKGRPAWVKWSAPAQSMRCFEHPETTTARRAMSRRKSSQARQENYKAAGKRGELLSIKQSPRALRLMPVEASRVLLRQLVRHFFRAVDFAQSFYHRARVNRDRAVDRFVENEV